MEKRCVSWTLDLVLNNIYINFDFSFLNRPSYLLHPKYHNIFCNIPKAKDKCQDFSLDPHVIETSLIQNFSCNE
jgi:hypothetical protein